MYLNLFLNTVEEYIVLGVKPLAEVGNAKAGDVTLFSQVAGKWGSGMTGYCEARALGEYPFPKNHADVPPPEWSYTLVARSDGFDIYAMGRWLAHDSFSRCRQSAEAGAANVFTLADVVKITLGNHQKQTGIARSWRVAHRRPRRSGEPGNAHYTCDAAAL